MRTFILRRLLVSAVTLFGLLTINFFIIHLAPGGPLEIFDNPDMSAEVRKLILKSYGLDQPLPIQYWSYLKSMCRLEFGYSIAKKRPVADEILDTLPNTIQLSMLALSLELSLGIIIGIVAAVRQDSHLDKTLRLSSLTLYSIPEFYLGLLFLLLFAGGVGALAWLPPSGMVDLVAYDSMGFFEKLADRILHLILPCMTIALGGAASISRYMRGQLLEVIRQDYIRTARAKGLSERAVIFKHGLRNALMPIITIIGLSLPVVFSGTVIVENVFGWPGMGRVAVDAAFQRDYPIFLAVNLMFGALVVAGNLLADILYAVVDPRVRLS
ncbi:MAG: ABC transporter permease [Planctomycetes bacterium]|nr:ABC transporter permease [Planctomycetota bacterium]